MLPERERRFLGCIRMSLAALYQAEVVDGTFKVSELRTKHLPDVNVRVQLVAQACGTLAASIVHGYLLHWLQMQPAGSSAT